MRNNRTDLTHRRWAAFGAAGALLLGVRLISGAAPAESVVSSQPVEAVVRPAASPAPELKYVGVGGCAAAACHGGALPTNPERLWNCSYTIWASQEPLEQLISGAGNAADRAAHTTPPLIDKHNRAYAVLYDDRSKQIVKLLDHLPSVKDAKPQLDRRCVACHSVPLDAATVPAAIRADGVGCEMCHGPAKNWLAAHTANDWLAGYHAGESKLLTDMKDTRSLLSRARTCAECHVGSPSDKSQLLRDVNHDLIAAGHPRLNFAFHAFLGVMPKHWTDTAGKAGFKPDSETHAEAWAIGQVVAAEAALRLLADRAESKPPSADHNRLRPWPEFSEYDCYACHHQLDAKFPSGRQAAASQPSGRKLGSPPWGKWYFSELRLLLQSPPFAARGADYVKQLDALNDAMAMPATRLNRADVNKQASALAQAMHDLGERLGAKTFKGFEETAIDGLLRSAAANKFQPIDWDEAAERFLTLDALWKARGKGASRPDEQLAAAAVEKMRKQLEFTPDFDSPKGFNVDLFVKDVYQPAAAQIRQALGPSDSK